MMQLQTSILLDNIMGVAYTTAGIVAATIIVVKLSKSQNIRKALDNLFWPLTGCHRLDAFPTVGSSSWLGSFWAGHKFETNAIDIIQEGYDTYRTVPFKVADRYKWIVVLGSSQHMEELRKAPDDALSFWEVANDMFQVKYTMAPEFEHQSYHVDIVRFNLTRNLANLYPEIRDEISIAFDDLLDLRDDEWKSVYAFDTIQRVVCRASNRIFVGLPLCRDPDWVDINTRYGHDVVEGAEVILRFPGFLAPFVAYFMTNVPGTTRRAIKHLAPIVEERRKLQEEYGNEWPGKPNDLLSWYMDEAPEGPERTIETLTLRILCTNFLSIDMSANSFYHALFLLAENPQYIQPLREEVESIIEKEGWSKASLGKMYKIDSFLKESERFTGITAVSLKRKAVRDFTFSDGTFIPKGTTILAPAQSLHLDNEHYKNANVFDPFRFCNMHHEQGKDTRLFYVSTSTEYLSFGYGKHACAGRFFAANELKTMLAHIVMSYDVKLEEGKTRPKGIRRRLDLFPDTTAKIMFRRRAC